MAGEPYFRLGSVYPIYVMWAGGHKKTEVVTGQRPLPYWTWLCSWQPGQVQGHQEEAGTYPWCLPSSACIKPGQKEQITCGLMSPPKAWVFRAQRKEESPTLKLSSHEGHWCAVGTPGSTTGVLTRSTSHDTFPALVSFLLKSLIWSVESWFWFSIGSFQRLKPVGHWLNLDGRCV